MEMTTIQVSMVSNATDTNTQDITVQKIFEGIRIGGKKLKGQITQIRNRFDAELAITGKRKSAKLAVDDLKKQLFGVLWSGRFTYRASDKLVDHSGLLCADLDALGERLPEIRKKVEASPHVFASFLSPTADGLKVIVRVASDVSKHLASFRAVQKLVRELCSVEIDESGKDPARLCFLSFDRQLYVNEHAIEIEPLPEPEKPIFLSNGAINLSERQRIAVELLGNSEWISHSSGYVPCPGKHLHTTGDGKRDCKIELDGAPTLFCFHNSCRGIVDGVNHELRSRIAKAEYKPDDVPLRVESQPKTDVEPVELPPAPAPYAPPPLDLLPPELQDYTCGAAESLNVDVSFILLPLLSSLGTAIGNSRAIWLKRGFIQYPVIWTGIIGRSGSRKSPSQHEACFAVMEHEQELMLQNKVATELYEEELVAWERRKPSDRAECKPEKPPFLACRCDDLTLEALADILVINPHGVLVQKDELSHFFASFDQYKHARGSDVSRWLSLHTAVSLAVDRRTDTRHYRIAYPHVSITGGIQPKILQRTLTSEYFERGLPARFIFAYPPFRQDRWNETTVPDDLHRKVWELFSELWLLQPNHGVPLPLPVEREAKEAFVRFYNQCGVTALEAGEQEEAVWSKLSGYGARLALIGQLAHTPDTDKISDGAIMEAACDLASWSGRESVRIYAELAETREQRECRELIEFIGRRDSSVTVRDVTHYYWRLKGQTEKAEMELTALVKSGFGKWEDSKPIGPGRPKRVFRLLLASPSPQFQVLRGETPNYGDGDVHTSQRGGSSI